ncbi:MAG: hypothetical protein ABI158_05635, partial [Edaphobacter sp.]
MKLVRPYMPMNPVVAPGRQVVPQSGGRGGETPGAPPVYRPQTGWPVQGKMAAPAAYRPPMGLPVQGKMGPPPVYRPASSL